MMEFPWSVEGSMMAIMCTQEERTTRREGAKTALESRVYPLLSPVKRASSSSLESNHNSHG
jgi:hypothetical protein